LSAQLANQLTVRYIQNTFSAVFVRDHPGSSGLQHDLWIDVWAAELSLAMTTAYK
jgi:hypothetical protein